MQIQCVSFPEVDITADTISSCGDATFDDVDISDLVADNPQWFTDTDVNEGTHLCTVILPVNKDISAEFTGQNGPYTSTGQSFVGGRPHIRR